MIDPGQWSCPRHGPWVGFDRDGKVMVWGEYVDDREQSTYYFTSGAFYSESIYDGDQTYGFRLDELSGELLSSRGQEAGSPNGLEVEFVAPVRPDRIGVNVDGRKVGYWGERDPDTRVLVWTYHPAVREYPP